MNFSQQLLVGNKGNILEHQFSFFSQFLCVLWEEVRKQKINKKSWKTLRKRRRRERRKNHFNKKQKEIVCCVKIRCQLKYQAGTLKRKFSYLNWRKKKSKENSFDKANKSEIKLICNNKFICSKTKQNKKY